MGCVIFNKDQLDLAKSMDEYLKSKPPDCSLFSEDGFEFPIHKELLYQTNLMRDMVKNNQLCHCSKIDIIVPDLARKKLEQIVDFLKTGELRSDKTAISDLLVDLTELFGFPKKIDTVFEFPKVKKRAFVEIIHNDVKLENQDMKSDPLSICDINSHQNNALIHDSKQRRNLDCGICGFKTDTAKSLLKHVDMTHENKETTICDIGGFNSTKKEVLQHVKKEHSNLSPYVELTEQLTNQISTINSKKIEINNSLSNKRNLIRPNRLKECNQDKYKKRGGPYCCVITGSSHINHQS